MEVALRRRLEGVETIAISQAQQSAVVTFTAGTRAFVPQDFREAVAEADVEVLRFEIEACGSVEETGVERWFVAGTNRFALSPDALERSASTCLTGALDDRATPHTLETIRPVPRDPS